MYLPLSTALVALQLTLWIEITDEEVSQTWKLIDHSVNVKFPILRKFTVSQMQIRPCGGRGGEGREREGEDIYSSKLFHI